MSPEPPSFSALPRPARVLVGAVTALAVGVVAVAQLTAGGPLEPLPFAICLALWTVGSFFDVRAPGGYWLQPHLPAFVAAVALLPPAAIAMVAVAVFLPGALQRGERWYRPAFNAATFALGGAIAGTVVSLTCGPGTAGELARGDVAALFAAVLVLVGVNHALVSAVSALTRGDAPRRALEGALRLRTTFGAGLFFDLALALTGASMAVMWRSYPEALPLAVGPAGLVCASLLVPKLHHASRTDAKTGLFNYGHVHHLMGVGIADATRTARPVSVLMVDLDHLRKLNNRHGHLLGDHVIAEVARVLAEVTGDRGSAGRFGGEEFCAVLPETTALEAATVAEEVRARVAALPVSGTRHPSTVSIGVASFPEHGADVEAVLHAADMALYDAKLGGRNRVRVAPPKASTGHVAVPARRRRRRGRAEVRATETARRIVQAAAEAHGPAAPRETPEPPVRHRRRRGAARGALLVSLCLPAAAGVAALAAPAAGTARIATNPVLAAVLLVALVVLAGQRADPSGRPRRLPPHVAAVLALAAVFGPAGPLAGGAALLAVRLARRQATPDAVLDFTTLAVAGGVAAGAFSVLVGAGLDRVLAGAAAGIVLHLVSFPLQRAGALVPHGRAARRRDRRLALLPHHGLAGTVAGMVAGAAVHTDRATLPLLLALGVAAVYAAERRGPAGHGDAPSHAELERANEQLRSLLDDNQALVARLQQSYLSTITSLARTIEAKDPYTGGHTERVARVATALAGELGFDGEDLRAVEVGAVIHDIGKIGVSDATLLKPGPLTTPELEEMRRHPEISSYIVAELDLPPIVKQMVRSHHERFDGGGYPDRLAAEEIPLAARILTVADALDAMTSDRPYRRARPLDEALAEIEVDAGTHFCPEVVDALGRCLRSERAPAVEALLAA